MNRSCGCKIESRQGDLDMHDGLGIELQHSRISRFTELRSVAHRLIDRTTCAGIPISTVPDDVAAFGMGI
jgi:hypothetical protein